VKDRNHDELADDIMVELNAVGANGGKPLPGFLEGEFGRDDHGHGNGCDDDDDHDHGHGHGHH
jgi:hypothetical protein